MSALNPNHPTVQMLDGNWHKLLAVLMLKHGETHVVLTPSDIAGMVRPVGTNIVAQELDDGLHLFIVDDATAETLAKREGGLPI